MIVGVANSLACIRAGGIICPMITRFRGNVIQAAALMICLKIALAPGPEYRLMAAPGQSADLLTTLEGFAVSRATSDGLIRFPIEADLDESGNLYVTESSGSNEKVEIQLEKKPHRIIRLSDTDSDGVYDRRTVFADGMMLPEGALWHDGSLYVSAPPAIWKLTDTDGDGVCDVREIWFDAGTLTGCANDLHGPYLGPDGWIYWCKGAFARQVHELTDGTRLESRASHVFRRHPDGGAVEIVMTGGMDNPVGLAFSDAGERFITTTFFQHPSDGLRDGMIHILYGAVYGKDHGVLDGHPRTGPLMPVMTHLGPAAPAGLIYDHHIGNAVFGDDAPVLLSCQFNLRKVGVHRLIPDGATWRTEDRTLLESEDFDFHPTDVLACSDGSYLVVDTGGWYQLCCPTSSLRENIAPGGIYRVYPSTSEGEVRSASGASRPDQIFTRLSSQLSRVRNQAIAELSQSRIHPEELLREFQLALGGGLDSRAETGFVWAMTRVNHPSARSVVRQFLNHNWVDVKVAAAHSVSLWRDREARRGLIAMMGHENDQVIRVALEALGRIVSPDDVEVVSGLLQRAAFTGSRILHHQSLYALIEMQKREGVSEILVSHLHQAGRKDIREVETILTSLVESGRIGELPSDLLEKVIYEISDGIPGALLSVVAGQLGGDELARLCQRLDSEGRTAQLQVVLKNANDVDAVIQWAGDRIRQQPDSLEFVNLAGGVWAGSDGVAKQPQGLAEAIELVLRKMDKGVEDMDGILAWCSARSTGGLPTSIRSRLLEIGMDHMRSGKVSGLQLITICSPLDFAGSENELFDVVCRTGWTERNGAGSVNYLELLSRSRMSAEQLEWVLYRIKDLNFLQRKWIWELVAAHRNQFENIEKPLRKAVEDSLPLTGAELEKLLSLSNGSSWNDWLSATRNSSAGPGATFNPETQIAKLTESLPSGDKSRGRQLFHSEKAACVSCHEIGYVGGNTGPDLTRVGQIRDRADLLESIVAPSRSLVRSYEPVIVEDVTGNVHHGIPISESGDGIKLRLSDGAVVSISREDVRSVEVSSISLMPEGYGHLLGAQDLADIIAYLKNE